MKEYMLAFLDKASEAYYTGNPVISDKEFDYLANKYNYKQVGYKVQGTLKNHWKRMYSLNKVYSDDKAKLDKFMLDNRVSIESPKLDGSAVSLLYVNGVLTLALTRGDGVQGMDITDKMLANNLVPESIEVDKLMVQINGEVVTKKTTSNPRNYVAGALHLKSLEEFNTRELVFVAYSIDPSLSTIDSYMDDMDLISKWFTTILEQGLSDIFPTDGVVLRVDSNSRFDELGFTDKAPRGAIAVKDREDVEILETTLTNVVWQLGKTGKVTPVAHFDEIVIDDAKISKATLHNAGFIEKHDLHIGDTILVTRAGGVIPKVVDVVK